MKRFNFAPTTGHVRVMSRVSLRGRGNNALIPALHRQNICKLVYDTAITTSKAPVPVGIGRPITMFPDGEVRSSKSPYKVASDRNAAVVS